MTNEQQEELIKSIAPHLGAGWYFDSLKASKWCYSLISGRKSLFFTHHQGRFTIKGSISPLKSLQQKFRIWDKTATTITVTDKKTPKQIATDIKKRIFPSFDETLKKVISNENFYINREEKLTLYANTLQPLVSSFMHGAVNKEGRNYLRFGEGVSIDFDIRESGGIHVTSMYLDFDSFYELVSILKRRSHK